MFAQRAIGPGAVTSDLRDRLQFSLGNAYTLERELGGGGMSRVFVAQETALGRRVVVKLLPPEQTVAVSAERFRREIQLVARLQHPHIVPVLAAGTADGLIYYTMPLVDGESLRELLRRRGELPLAEAVPLLRGIASALAYAHRHGIVHRDVKPENVLVSGEYGLVTDFGVAKAIVEASLPDAAADGAWTLTSRGVALGTPAYMAPEQAAADPATDHRADIYAFGCVAYEMLAGRPLFEGRTASALLAAHSIEVPESLARRRPSVPPELAALVMRCLEKRPADRPQSADDIVRALDTLSAPVTAASRPIRRETSRRTAAWISAMVLAIGLVAAGLVMRRRETPPAVNDSLVAVLPFRVTAADPSLRYLREGMLDLLAAKLADRPRAIDPRAVLTAWRRAGGDDNTDPEPKRALTIATGLGAGRLLAGEVVGNASRLVLSARLNEAPSGRERARASVSGAVGDLARLVDSLAAKLLALDAGEESARASMLGGVDLAALQAFLAGQQAMRAGEYQRAADAFGRAVERDSTFAIAAVRLYAASLWSEDPRGPKAAALALRQRDRIGSRDVWTLPAADSRDQPITTAAAIARAERAVSAVPDMPELWFRLGDLYFHYGPILAVPDVNSRSARAFERALALDSTLRPAFEHLPSLYELLGDTSGVKRSRAQLARDTTGDFWPVTRFLGATDAAERRAAVERLLRGPISFALVPVHASPMFIEWTPEAAELLRRTTERAVSADDRRAVTESAYRTAMNRGQPTRGALLYDADIFEAQPATALDAIFWDGDSAAAAPRLARLARLAASSAPVGEQGRKQWVDATFLVAQATLARGGTAGVAESIRRLLALPAIDTMPLLTELPRWYAILLDAQLAAATQREDAGRRLTSLDSVLRLGPLDMTTRAVGNLVAARLLEQRQDLPRAYAALLRTTRGPVPTPFGSTYVRERARLAALLGDRDAAIRDYRRYLSARGDAEPALAAHIASVRAELARLERERSGR
jgi:eukaryotic-like serine/threonine-protein kinase